MTADPAVHAAQRAKHPAWAFVDPPGAAEDIAIRAAREALAPLRAKHQKVQRPDGTYRCTSCRDAYGAHADWPTGTDQLLYSEDELT
ncbi:hypothetical protein [Gordonia alkanivorans]|uniref:Uncharacterized protein n=2 Tax=root TaxID=1 RepID=A0A162E182_9CAUD|nr:hypothetical protein [Gordonia alkanivorans]YP_009324450.1 hypothetical protein BOX05_gp58 [Gordonia phage GAL1]AKJ72073.1 hypothetical protein GAL1_58 [Gordonia phage GAL1]GAA13867.1 hypothetical protein GOALK_093_00550 [Gordonia alkanivorans NBRC 16433]